MTNQESTLSKSIYQNMQLKDSDELLKIWVKNDRLEWSDEAFSIIHDILLERLGNVPEQKTGVSERRRKRKGTEKTKIPASVFIIFSPVVVVLFLIALVPVINPGIEDEWFTILFLVSMALFFFIPGLYFGWKSFFQGEQTKKKATENLPNMKKQLGIFYRFSTYFLPDRFAPIYFLYAMRFLSFVLISGGIRMIMFLMDVL